jgi:hypothetical protein
MSYQKLTRQEFETELKRRCPRTMRLLKAPKMEGQLMEPIQFGLEIKAGWHDLVMACALKLESLNCGVEAVQIKEKFGTLRFYIEKGNASVNKAIAEAEALASKTCEYCGAPGELRTDKSWWKTMCFDCRKVPVIIQDEPD